MDGDAVHAVNTQQIGVVLIPYGYEVWNDGVYYIEAGDPPDIAPDPACALPNHLRRGRKRLTQRPIWLSTVGVAVDTKEPLVKIFYLTPGGLPEEVWVERGDITDHKLLGLLGARGLPIDSLNCRDLLAYLRAGEALNARTLPNVMVGHRSGPYLIPGAGVGWLVGSRWIGPGHLEADPRGNQRYTNAMHPHGDWETWREKWRELYDKSWVTRWLIAATFTPPLLRLTKTRTFIVHHWGDSSKGKCLRFSSLVSTSAGLRRIGELDRPEYADGFTKLPYRVGEKLRVWNGEKFVRATHFFKGKSKTTRIRTRRGFEIVGTPEHPMMTERGWVRLDALQLDDRVRFCPPVLPDDARYEDEADLIQPDTAGIDLTNATPMKSFYVDLRVARLLGYLVADGWNGREGGFSISSDPEILDDAERIVREVFGHTHFNRSLNTDGRGWTLKWHSKIMRQTFATRLGLGYETAGDKNVPHAVMRAKPLVREFLRGYIDCDGSFDPTCIEVTTKSEELGREVQVLLAACGIMSRRHERQVLYEGTFRPYWRVSVTGLTNILAYAREIGVVTQDRKVRLGTALVSLLDPAVGLRKCSTFDTDSFDEVAEIVPSDVEEPVFDLTVPDGHAFSANGLLSHNTAIARFAMSAWGDADALFSSLNRTAISLTEVFRHVTDLPVLFDEKQVSTVTPEEVIYSICLPSGRERGARFGGLREDRQSWLTVARTTGEEPLIKSRDLGGQANRVLQIHSQAFADSREAEALYPFVAEHYGHAGPLFLMYLAQMINTDGGLPRIINAFGDLRKEIADRIGQGDNHVGYATNIALGHLLSATWLLGIDIESARRTAIADAEEALSETAPLQIQSYAERALGLLRDHWMAYPYCYADDLTAEGKERMAKFGGTRNFMVGSENGHGMGFIPAQADKILIDGGYHPDRVWRDFATRGWLSLNNEGGLQMHMVLRPETPLHPVYFVRNAVWRRYERSSIQLIQGGRGGAGGGAAAAVGAAGGTVLSFPDAVTLALNRR